MDDLTLVIPAKQEPNSLPIVLNEIKNYRCKKIIILEKDDFETINAIKNFDIKIVYQSGKGYGNAIREGIDKVETSFSKELNSIIEVYSTENSIDMIFEKSNLLMARKDLNITQKIINLFNENVKEINIK